MSSSTGSRITYVFIVVVVGVLAFVYSEMDDFGYLEGTVDLRDGSALTFHANSDDTLRFPAFVTVDVGALEGTSAARGRAARQAMASSTLHVHLASASGGETELTCSLWSGSVTSEESGTRLTEARIWNDCTYDVMAPGDYTVRANVDWAPELVVVEAHIEVRDELAAD